MNTETSNEHLHEIVSLQRELLENQKQSFAQLISLQKQYISNQESDAALRRKFLRVMAALIVVYVVMALLPIWLR